MAIRSADDESTAQNVWRELASRQGAALEAYARTLKGYGAGRLPAEAVAREAVDLTARGTADVVRVSIEFAQDFYRWAWSLVGVRVEPGRGQNAETAAHAHRTASSSREATSGEG